MSVCVLAVDGLTVEYRPEGRAAVRAVDAVSFDVHAGETVAVVGESGSGKSTLARAVIGTVREPGRIAAGAVRFRGDELTTMSEGRRRAVRGCEIAYIPQDPLAALNPVHRVGAQVAEVLRAHRDVSRRDAWSQAVSLLARVGLPDAGTRARDYPHRLSGGERQRVAIAMAVALDPALLVADEPTTALDATVQAQILDLLVELREESGSALLIVTHDLGVVGSMADRVVVLYAGRVAELADARDLYRSPGHRYSAALLGAAPRLGDDAAVQSVPGAPPPLDALPDGCAFHPRCSAADQRCHTEQPTLGSRRAGWLVACHHPCPTDG